MLKRKLNIGMIGVGMVAERHIECILKDDRAVVRWLCDKNETVLKEKQEKYQIEMASTQYQDLLMDPELDAVIIATPPFTHAEIFMNSMKAGKHVLVEKPLGMNETELKAIVEAAVKHPELVLMECSCRHTRLQPKYGVIKKLIEEGRLGEVYYIHHNSVARQGRAGIEYHPTAKWFLNKKMALGGPMVDWGVYDLAFHLGILGDNLQLTSIETFTKNGLDQVAHGAPVFDVEEHGAAFMQFDNGLRYFYERASNAHNEVPNETRIYGTKGGLKFQYNTWESNELELFFVEEDGKGKAAKEKLLVDMSSHRGDEQELAAHFIDCMLGIAQPQMPVALAAKHLDILFKIVKP